MANDNETREKELRFRETEMRKKLFELFDRLNKLTKIDEICTALIIERFKTAAKAMTDEEIRDEHTLIRIEMQK